MASINNWNPVRPLGRAVVLNRRSRMHCGLRFAACPGAEGGFGSASQAGSWDDYYHRLGAWEDGATQTCYHGNQSYGVGTEPGASPSRHAWSESGSNIYDWPTGHSGRSTYAVLVRMDNSPNATFQTIFKKRSGNQANTDNGWEFITNTGNTWAFRVCDGVTQVLVASTTVQATEATLVRNDMLIATVDGTNLTLWVNGIREGVVATAVLPTNNNQPIRFFGNNVTAEFCACYIGMAAVWDRVLPDSEVQNLFRDPFTLWRHLGEEDLLADSFVPGGGGVADDCCCCVINSALMF